jgi:hypothetical protein
MIAIRSFKNQALGNTTISKKIIVDAIIIDEEYIMKFVSIKHEVKSIR